MVPSRSAGGREEQTVPSFSLPYQGSIKGHPCQDKYAVQHRQGRELGQWLWCSLRDLGQVTGHLSFLSVREVTLSL